MEYIIIILWTLGAINMVGTTAAVSADWHGDAGLFEFALVFFWPLMVVVGLAYSLFSFAVSVAKNNNPYL